MNILIVEGESDKGFFSEICKKLNLNTDIKVGTPKDWDGYNSKEGVFTLLDTLLLSSGDEGHSDCIAAIVDADYINHGQGREKTLKRASEIIQGHGFKPAKKSNFGYLFENDEGLPTIGLWIMPTNEHNEGMLEDWIKLTKSETENNLFEKATTTISQISEPKFKPHLTSKAEVATWLAWQKTPGHGFYYLVTEKLLDEEQENYKALCLWLKEVFNH